MKFTFAPESKPLDGYTIKRAIQRGGFGEVYYALSDGGKEVALKLLRDNLDVELRGVSQCLNLKHPNLVTIFDVRTDSDGDHWIVMEFVAGASLEQTLNDVDGPLPSGEISAWLNGTAAGLDYLHDRGIVHRDLKPANIFRESGIVKIGDVGLAKFISASKRSAQTQSVGTVYYMAPEVARGRYGREVDVYSLGIVLYEMLTGNVPFEGESTAEILMKHLAEHPDLSVIPAELRPVLERALAKDPMKRTPTAGELARDFHIALSGGELPLDIPEEAYAETTNETVYPDEPIPEATVQSDPPRTGHRPGVPPRPVRGRRARKRQLKAVRHALKARKHAFKADCYARAAGATARPRPLDETQVLAAEENGGWPESVHLLIRGLAIAIVVLALVAPGFLAVVLRIGFLVGVVGALVYGTVRLIGLLTGAGSRRHTIPSEETVQATHASRQHTAAAATQQRGTAAASPRPRYTQPVRRTLTPRQHWTELTGSLTFAALATVLITAGVVVATGFLPDAPQILLFGGTTLLASWTILAASRWWEGSEGDGISRRLILGGLGALVGMAAFWMQETLLVVHPYDQFDHPAAIFDHVGSHELLSSSFQPTMAAWIVFFGGLFSLVRWWSQTDPMRRRRFRILTLGLTLLTGYVFSTILLFPHGWAMMFAATISSVVMLSSVWMPRQQAH